MRGTRYEPIDPFSILYQPERDPKREHQNIITLYCTYIDIQKFNTKYLVMYKVQMHTGAISKLEYGSCVCTGDNQLADARGLSSRTDAQTIL